MTEFPVGARELLLLALGLAGVYLFATLARLFGLGRLRNRQREASGQLAADTKETSLAPSRDEPAFDARPTTQAAPVAVSPPPTFEWHDVRQLFGTSTAASAESAPESPVRPPGIDAAPATVREHAESIDTHLAHNAVEMEMQRMRDEISRLREELEALRSAQRVSPQYAEAMELAQRGLTAQDVADRLGISLAEAELVQALSRSNENFVQGEDDGADAYATGSGGFVEGGRRLSG